MAWTYQPELISSSPRNAVRFTIGDTDETDPLLLDEELDFLLSQNANNVNRSALAALDAVLATLARKIDKSVGSLSISYSQKYAHYREIADRVRTQSRSTAGIPLAGGLPRVNTKSPFDRVGTAREDSAYYGDADPYFEHGSYSYSPSDDS